MKHEVDKYFPRNGSCMFHRTRYARHRLIDALKMLHQTGASVSKLMRDYQLPRKAILAAINSTADDNRMTPKEIRESDESYKWMLGNEAG